ncbi:MAG: DUF4381 domain-containing protein [Acidobacteriota bacterium]
MPEEFGNPWMTNLVQPSAPEAVPWWPPAPGWYVLAGLVLIALGWLVLKVFRRWRADAYRRAALRLVRVVEQSGSTAELPALLKRTALSTYPRSDVASLSGEAWLAFLDGTLGTTDFSSGPGRPLVDLAFAAGGGSSLSEGERKELVALAKRWIKGHRRGRE